MKKIVLLTLLLGSLVLAGCNSERNITAGSGDIEQRSDALEAATAEPKEQSKTSANKPEIATTAKNLDILSFELSETDPDASLSSVRHTYKVTNNGSEPIEYISLDLAYYDADGNCIDTDGRYKDVVVEPEKFITVDSYGGSETTKDNIASSKVVSYYYRLVTPNASGNNAIEVNCETGKTREFIIENQ